MSENLSADFSSAGAVLQMVQLQRGGAGLGLSPLAWVIALHCARQGPSFC